MCSKCWNTKYAVCDCLVWSKWISPATNSSALLTICVSSLVNVPSLTDGCARTLLSVKRNKTEANYRVSRACIGLYGFHSYKRNVKRSTHRHASHFFFDRMVVETPFHSNVYDCVSVYFGCMLLLASKEPQNHQKKE